MLYRKVDRNHLAIRNPFVHSRFKVVDVCLALHPKRACVKRAFLKKDKRHRYTTPHGYSTESSKTQSGASSNTYEKDVRINLF